MDLTGNPWVIYPGDTVPEGYVEIRPVDAPVFIDSIEWSNYSGVTDAVDLKDGRDREVFFRLGETNAPTLSKQFQARTPIYGLRLYNLTAGQLCVFLR